MRKYPALLGLILLAAGPLTAGPVARAADAPNDAADKLRVYADGIALPAEATANAELMTTAGATKANCDVSVARDNGEFLLRAKDGTTLRRIADNEDAPRLLAGALENQWRWRFLSQLHNDDATASLKVEFRLVPLNVRTDANGKVQEVLGARKVVEMNGARPVLREGDNVVVQLRNRSAVDVYLTLLDLSPDGAITQIFPDPQSAPQYNIVPADGNWHPAFRPFEIGPPFGQELFKAIATRSYVDFRPAESAHVTVPGRGAPELTLGKLLLMSSSAKRAPGPGQLAAADWSTFEVQADLKPKR